MTESEYPEVPQDPKISDSMDTLMQAVQKSASAFAASGVSEIMEEISSSFAKCAASISQVFNQAMHDYWTLYATQIHESMSRLAEVVSSIKIPRLTEEEKEQLVGSAKAWGAYGWTYIPSMPLVVFDTPPADIAEANRLAMQYCTDSEMEKLFDTLRKVEVNQEDLESAVFCYQNEQYKACALLLCGLIDGRLIRVSPGKKRPVGKGAVWVVKNKYKDIGEKILAEAMFAQNLLSYLDTLFERKDGFYDEPETLNRNFISHGMNRRSVRKRDCIQLFLALNNLIQFFDFVLTNNETKED